MDYACNNQPILKGIVLRTPGTATWMGKICFKFGTQKKIICQCSRIFRVWISEPLEAVHNLGEYQWLVTYFDFVFLLELQYSIVVGKTGAVPSVLRQSFDVARFFPPPRGPLHL